MAVAGLLLVSAAVAGLLAEALLLVPAAVAALARGTLLLLLVLPLVLMLRFGVPEAASPRSSLTKP